VAIHGYSRKRKRAPERFDRPNITSLADVTLVLLVIFLVSSTAAVEMMSVDLPPVAANATVRDLNLAFTITISNHSPGPATATTRPASAGNEKTPWLYYFEEDQTGIEPKNLWTALRKIKQQADWPFILVRADKNAPGECVATLVQCLGGLGVETIGFAVDTKE